jgi:hypothetical protein
MNCQVKARLVFRRNCFGVVGPTRARGTKGDPLGHTTPGVRCSPLATKHHTSTSRTHLISDENRARRHARGPQPVPAPGSVSISPDPPDLPCTVSPTRLRCLCAQGTPRRLHYFLIEMAAPAWRLGAKNSAAARRRSSSVRTSSARLSLAGSSPSCSRRASVKASP